MTRTRPVIAIDGPVGAGKSTVARELARALGFEYLNTGAMYRAVAIAARAAGMADLEAGSIGDDVGRAARLRKLLEAIAIEFDGGRIRLNGRDVTDQISDPVVSEDASRLSTIGAVRERMRELQRAAGERGGIVMEGRDIGTAVFPDAECKFYLDASAAVRAERRWRELAARGAGISRAEVLAQLIERDRRDSERALAPLQAAADAIVVDSGSLTIEEVVAMLKARIASRA
ncbi:MAG TPA: (d)CMP kinase [Candidatus Binataceae bacterium]|nr:(d)CMP kinase [Candidatus Binataceae bacterium]